MHNNPQNTGLLVTTAVITMAQSKDQIGVVSIEVVAGRDLVAMDDDGTSDPYVCCIVGPKKKKTKIIRDTLNPQWSVGEREFFQFKVRKDVENIILECYDWDRFNADDRMGLVTIPLASLKDEKLHDEWYTLVPMKSGDEVSGQLHIKIQFTSVITEKHQKNPLVIAIKAGDAQKVHTLLSQSDFDPNPVDAEKNTPLHLASVGSNFKILSTLLSNRKVNVKAVDSDGNTPLHVFAQKFVSPNHCEEIVAQFLERGADLNSKNTKLDTPLHKACLNVSVRVVMAEALLKRGAKVNEVNVEGERPIDYAIRLGRGDLCDLLIKFGISPKLVPHINLARSLQFHQIADKLQGLQETYEWCQKLGMEHVGIECIKNHITKDQLPLLKGSSALKSLGFKSDAEKDKFLSEASRIGKIPADEENFPKRPTKKEKPKGQDKRDTIGSLKYGQLQTEQWVIDYESLEFSESLGKGASGQVFSGFYGGKRVAIKTLPNTEVVENEFMREFQIICVIQAPQIVKFYGACLKPKLCIVMEFCEQGSLHDVLARPNLKVGWDRVFKWALGTVDAIHSLHHFTPSIMHRDLKSLNVLITADDTAKVCDFGLSRFDTSSNLGTMQKLRGTYHYVAPELYSVKNSKFTFQSDVYSIGIILWELVNRCITQKYAYPFSEYPNLTQDFQVLIGAAKRDMRPTVPVTCPAPFRDLILKCYSKTPEERPTTEELKEKLTSMEADFKKNPEPWNSSIIPL